MLLNMKKVRILFMPNCSVKIRAKTIHPTSYISIDHATSIDISFYTSFLNGVYANTIITEKYCADIKFILTKEHQYFFKRYSHTFYICLTKMWTTTIGTSNKKSFVTLITTLKMRYAKNNQCTHYPIA